MSGGAMDYVFGRIETAAEDVACELRRIEVSETLADFVPADCYRERYPSVPELANAETVKEAVVKRLRDAEETLRKAAIYARRVEWLLSGDDGYENFILRTDNELAALKEGKAL